MLEVKSSNSSVGEGEQDLAFRKGVYNDGYMKFSECGKCGKKFKRGDVIWKRFTANKSGAKIKAYLCEECYDGLFIEL